MTSLQKGSVCTTGRDRVNFLLNAWPWISFYELLQTPHGMTEMEEPLRNYVSTEKPINTNCSEKELSTQIETGIVKSVTDVFKGFFRSFST